MGAAERITNSLVQEWVEKFLEKNHDYKSEPMPGFPKGFENADVLGVQGQFAEIWRKIWKLYKGMWKGETLKGESVREVLLDLIGHCFLAIDMIDRATPVAPEARPIRVECGRDCTGSAHAYVGSCAFRRNGI